MNRWLFAILGWLWQVAWRPYCLYAPPKTKPREQLEDAAYRIMERRSKSLAGALPYRYRSAWRLLARHAQLETWALHRNEIRRQVERWARGMGRRQLFEHLLETSLLPEGVAGTGTFFVATTGDNSDGLTWAKAKTTITAGLAVATDATFNFLYVDAAYAVTAGAAVTWNVATSGTFVAVICVTPSGASGDSGLNTTAAESVGASSNAFTILTTPACNFYCYGLVMNGGTNNAAQCDIILGRGTVHFVAEFVNCTFDVKSSNAAAFFEIGGTEGGGTIPSRVVMRGCTIKLPSASGMVPVVFAKVIFEASALAIAYTGATKPTGCFGWVSGSSFAEVRIRDSDLSGYNTTSGNLFTVTNFNAGQVVVTNCSLSSTPGIVTGTWQATNKSSITLINVDSGDTHNVLTYYNRLGTSTVNTSVYRDSGETFDAAHVSWQIVTTASCSEQEPFVPFRELGGLNLWSDATSSKTFTIEMIFDNATDLTDRTCWAEFSVLENASLPNGTLTSTRNARPFDGSGVALTSSSEAWTGAGGFSNSKKRKLSVTRTAAERSTIQSQVYFGVASWTGYLDPMITAA